VSRQNESSEGDARRDDKHRRAMQKQKQQVDAAIGQADGERGILLLLTGDGKGKSSSAFGMVMRALGYGQKVAVVQFIKGEQLSGEELWLRQHCPDVALYQMGTGFTWNTQNRQADIEAAQRTWACAARYLVDPDYDLVVLDELTYMLAYDYLDPQRVLSALAARPVEQSVVVTGRGGGRELRELADTVSEIKEIKHAFRAGIKARKGVDY
jgi:cob(I)alamin adenosyltransferase